MAESTTSTTAGGAVPNLNGHVSGSTTPGTPVPDYVFTEPVTPPQFIGHLGFLNKAQSEAFDAFKKLADEDGCYRPESLSEDGEKVVPSHDDVTLLRFLRARSFDPSAALVQFKRAEQWREEMDVDNLFATGFSAEELDASRRFYPRWTGRRTKQGLPLFAYRISELDAMQKELDAVPAKRRYQRIVALYELMCRFTLPMCSHLPHPTSPNPISCTTNIIDLADVSFSSMFRLRGHFQEASKLATPYYPETLGMIIVVNAPSFFPTIWSWIKGWFDEGTRHKIHILGRDTAETMLTLIDAENLPKIYGGELEWSFRDPPNMDQDVKAIFPGGLLPKGMVIFKDGQVLRPDGTPAIVPPSSSSPETSDQVKEGGTATMYNNIAVVQ